MNKAHANILRNFQNIRNRISAAGGNPDKVDIVAVTKGRSQDEVKTLLSIPVAALAGNYPDELIETANCIFGGLSPDIGVHKFPPVALAPEWHFIGQIQKRNIKRLSSYVSLWQSVDRVEEIEKIAEYAPKSKILLEVNGYDLAAKAYKNSDIHPASLLKKTFSDDDAPIIGNIGRGGIAVDEIENFIESALHCDLSVKGFMTIAPLGDSDLTRASFDMLGELTEKFGMSVCSMGMSSDFELAVKSGSNMLRIGKALFA